MFACKHAAVERPDSSSSFCSFGAIPRVVLGESALLLKHSWIQFPIATLRTFNIAIAHGPMAIETMSFPITDGDFPSFCSSLPKCKSHKNPNKPPFSYGFPMVFLWNHHFSCDFPFIVPTSTNVRHAFPWASRPSPNHRHPAPRLPRSPEPERNFMFWCPKNGDLVESLGYTYIYMYVYVCIYICILYIYIYVFYIDR